MPEVRFDRLVPSEIVARREQRNLAYLPVGNLEWHGNHMPFGTDYLTVTYIAEESARRLGGVVFPPIYYGDVRYMLHDSRAEWRQTYAKSLAIPEAYGAAFPIQNPDGSYGWAFPTQPDDGPAPEDPLPFGVAEQEREFVRLIARTLLEIHLYGFRQILLLPGHGPNPLYCRRAEELYRQNVRRRSAFGEAARTRTLFYFDLAKAAEPLLGKIWLHADKWEGSITMVAAPGTVRPELLPEDKATIPPAYLGEPYLNERDGLTPASKELQPYIEYFDPRNGMSHEYGARQMEAVLQALGRELADWRKR